MKETLDINIAVLEALKGAAAIAGYNGEIFYANKNWRKYSRQHLFGLEKVKENYFAHLEEAVKNGNDYALKLIFGLRKVLDGEKSSFEMSIPLKFNNDLSWSRVTVSNFDDENNQALIIFDDISKNISLHRAKRESQEFYLQHFNNSMQGVLLSSLKGDIFDANPAACKILGYTRDELIKGGCSLIVEKDDPLLNKPSKTGEAISRFEGEKVYVHKNGHTITAEISSILYRDSDGNLKSINTFRDKTNEKIIERTLEEERHFNEAAIGSIPGTFFVFDSNFKLKRWNNVFISSLGYSQNELKNKNAIDFIADGKREVAVKAAKDVFRNGSGSLVTEIKTKNNGIRVYQILANKFTRNGEEFLVGTGTDITHVIEAEEEKEKSISMMSQLFDNSPLAMILIDPNNKITRVNKGFVELFGYTKSEVLGNTTKNLICKPKQYEETKKISTRAFNGTAYKLETKRYTKNDQELSVLINTVPVKCNGNIIAVYGIYVNLTDQKSLEQKLQTSLHEKEVLFSEIHHRVKNNLAVVAGLLDLQIEDEKSLEIKRKLNEVRSRIFSIARINESLYGKNNVVSIRFDEYLKTVMENLPQKDMKLHENININLQTDPVSLNLNQAVSGGLIINELLNIILDGEKYVDKLDIRLQQFDSDIEVSIEGNGIHVEQIDRNNNFWDFQTQLIDILLSQIDAEIQLSDGDSKIVTLSFKKAAMSGPSSSIKYSDDLNFNEINN